MAEINDELICRDLLDFAGTISQKISYLFSTLPITEIDIPNIGITYNNKLVEIIQTFKSHGVPLDDNLLTIVITNYLIRKVNNASLILISYSQTFRQQKQIGFLKRNTLEQRKRLADRYKAIDDEIFNFSLEKNIVAAIIADIRNDLENEKNGCLNKYNEMACQIIGDYKKDLCRLGVSQETLDSIPDFKTSFGSL